MLYRRAEICTSLMLDKRGAEGYVALSPCVSLVTAPVDPENVRHYFGELKGFPEKDDLITIFLGGGGFCDSIVICKYQQIAPPCTHRFGAGTAVR